MVGAHFSFEIPVSCGLEDTCDPSVDSNQAQMLLKVSLIICDEIVMCLCHSIEALGSILKYTMQNMHLLRGKEISFAGDFRLILPLNLPGSRAQMVITCVRSSFRYDSFQKFRKTENVRLLSLLHDPDASEQAVKSPQFLMQVRKGKISADASNNFELLRHIYFVSAANIGANEFRKTYKISH